MREVVDIARQCLPCLSNENLLELRSLVLREINKREGQRNGRLREERIRALADRVL